MAIICGGNGFEGLSDDTILVEIVDSEEKHNILDEVGKEEIDEVISYISCCNPVFAELSF